MPFRNLWKVSKILKVSKINIFLCQKYQNKTIRMIPFNWKVTEIPADTEIATEWSAIFSNCQILLEVIHPFYDNYFALRSLEKTRK